MHSQFVSHDYRAVKPPAVLAEERSKKAPRFLVLHGEIGRQRNHPLRETEKFMQPYLALATVKRCVSCGVTVKQGVMCCANCRKLISIVSSVKSWMRSYLKNGNVKLLQNAAAKIRRYQLEPEDLRWL
jgi:hypothetical protein